MILFGIATILSIPAYAYFGSGQNNAHIIEHYNFDYAIASVSLGNLG
jgi:hypothetical protein